MGLLYQFNYKKPPKIIPIIIVGWIITTIMGLLYQFNNIIQLLMVKTSHHGVVWIPTPTWSPRFLLPLEPLGRRRPRRRAAALRRRRGRRGRGGAGGLGAATGAAGGAEKPRHFTRHWWLGYHIWLYTYIYVCVVIWLLDMNTMNTTTNIH